MKCPLFYSFGAGSSHCLGEECALWNKRYGCCDEVAKTKILEAIHEDLYAISVKKEAKDE